MKILPKKLTIIDVLKQQIRLGRAKTTRLLKKGYDELGTEVYCDSDVDIKDIVNSYECRKHT